MAFFPAVTDDLKKPELFVIPRCGACELSKSGCESPKMEPGGDGYKGILVVGDSPNDDEDSAGRHSLGPTGRMVRQTLARFNVDLDQDCLKTNSLICKNSEPGDTKKLSQRIDYCRPNITKLISEKKPRVIILLGQSATRSVLAPIWKENPGDIVDWVGWQIPSQRYNCWICPTYDPSFVMEKSDSREGPVYKLLFDQHLERAVALKGRPWPGGKVPDYKNLVKVVFDPEQAATWIRDKIRQGGAVSLDYETNMLKPEFDKAEIICASVCWKGLETIAFPWVGEAIVAMGELIRSKLPKIGANNKFEDRWSKVFLGDYVRNWVWDTMLSAHHLDCREGITSVKFQGFVRLGVEDWGWAIKPYLSDDDSDDHTNRIKEVDLNALLLYCGIDAIIEYQIAEIQRREMNGKVTYRDDFCVACEGLGKNSYGVSQCPCCKGSGLKKVAS